mgnify:CR=1 FL=1
MEEVKPYPDYIQSLNTFAGFFVKFNSFKDHGDRALHAYEKVEQLHLKYFGRRRYSDYNSFRSAIVSKSV